MKPRFSFTFLPLALLPLALVPQPIQGQCPCSSIPIPSSSGPESLRKQGCLKPAFRDFTVEYEADPNPPANGGNPNLSVMVGDMEVFLAPGEKKRVRVSDASAAPGPVSGEKVATSAAPAPGAMYQMAPNAKVKVNTGGDSKSNNTCRASSYTSTTVP